MKIFVYDSGKGIISFLKLILKNQKNNDYFFYIDKKSFPLGEKDSSFIKNRLKTIITKVNKENYNLLIICCNTASIELDITLKNSCKCPINTIFDYTIRLYNSNRVILCSNHLYKKLMNENINALDVQDLINNIESNNILNCSTIINDKLSFTKYEIILGCTHLTHIRFLLKNVKTLDPLLLLVDDIPNCGALILSGNKAGLNEINKYFIHNNIIGNI